MRRIYAKIKFEQQTPSSEGRNPTPHFALLGNPGTGKTTTVQRLATLFKGMDLLKHDTVCVVRPAELVADSEKASRAKIKSFVAMAKGGVLLLDEAHYWVDFGVNSGIVDELIKVMDNSFFGVTVMI